MPEEKNEKPLNYRYAKSCEICKHFYKYEWCEKSKYLIDSDEPAHICDGYDEKTPEEIEQSFIIP